VHELQHQFTGALQTDLPSLPPSSLLPSLLAAAAAFVAGPGNEAVEGGRAEKEELNVIIVEFGLVPRGGREGGREGGRKGGVGVMLLLRRQ
jgi:hypothetical protein